MKALMFTLSTGHLTEETAQWLSEPNSEEVLSSSLSVYSKGQIGWFVHVPDDIDTSLVPNDLRRILEIAREHDYQWVMFDRDEEYYTGLPSYSW